MKMRTFGGLVFWGGCLVLATSSVVLALPQPSSPPVPSSPTVLAVPGDTVRFSWPLPPGLRDGLLLVSLRTPASLLFLATTSSSSQPLPAGSEAAVVMPDYLQRVKVSDTMTQGQVQFTLSNVSFQDAGPYICARGMTEVDVVGGCGATLVVLDAPVNASIAAVGTVLAGKDVTLRCQASSVSRPRDHHQPMKFRWYESSGTENQPVWREATPSEGEPSSEQSWSPEVFDAGDPGSGEPEPDGAKGNHSDSPGDVLGLRSLARSDEGRRFVCAASEGLGLWSAKSAPFVLRPEWKPSPSDLTLTPAGGSMTLTSGESQNVTCQARCRPGCSIVWKKVRLDEQGLTLAEDGTLALKQVGPQHQGVYRCQASNRHGSAFITLTLSVQERPKPWYRNNSLVITVVAVAAIGLALGMTGVALVVYKYRQRTTPFVWPHTRVTQDALPLSTLENRPSLSSYC